MRAPPASPGPVRRADPELVAALARWVEATRLRRLDNGLRVCLLERRAAPLVACALCYRAGSRNEPAGRAGVAHFLEHMMFKGSPRYPAGEVDRRTQALGGDNNAFTTQDATLYHFTFAADRWTEALAIEADRMAELALDPAEIERERAVIREEIGMVENDPWEALGLAIWRAFFGRHPYGRSILGSAASLAAIGAADLAAFHRRHYRPANAVLVLAGDLGDEAFEAAAGALGGLPAGRPSEPVAAPRRPVRLERVERRLGEVPRLLLALPAAPPASPDYAALRLAAALLTGGRASRLSRALVEEGRLCVGVSADLAEMPDAALVTIGAEAVPGTEPGRIEAVVLDELARLAEGPIDGGELERARQILLADWVFDHEHVQQQAVESAQAIAAFDEEFLRRHLGELATCGAGRVRSAVREWLDPDRGGVLGWSLPAEGEG